MKRKSPDEGLDDFREDERGDDGLTAAHFAVAFRDVIAMRLDADSGANAVPYGGFEHVVEVIVALALEELVEFDSPQVLTDFHGVLLFERSPLFMVTCSKSRRPTWQDENATLMMTGY
jgi:hypothetical protein